MAQPAVRHPSIEETIDGGFVTEDRTEVIEYLRENADLLPVLATIKDRLGPPLLAPQPLVLDLTYDPEWEDDPPRLFVRIPTTLDVDPALDAMDEIIRDWWIDEFRRFGDRLNLTLDYR